ncbi:ATP-binding protein [Candidatus Micrarchaeota archaeon]|nr:ATP-binding protein [Candidatus Micrarchaeota archaeon]
MFIGRKNELSWLEEMLSHSKKKLFPIVIYGPRRVGKTTLIKRFMEGKESFYFFVNETKSSPVLASEAANEIRKKDKKAEMLSLESWDKILKYLIEESPFEAVIFDEFQNFQNANSSVFGTLQNLIDSNENKGKLLIFLGSSTGMMKELFEDTHAALYGRIKSKLFLSPLGFRDCIDGLKKMGYKEDKEMAGFYFVFGGYPKYLSALEDFSIGAKPINELLRTLFFSKNAAFQEEVQDVLRAEFGKRGANYYSIMEAIATGHTKLSEIASYSGLSVTSLSPFMRDLCDYHELVERKLPIMRSKTRDTRYALKSPLFRFWFRFVRPNLSSLEIGRYDLLMENIKKNLDSYSGLEFERLAKEYLVSNAGKNKLDFSEIGGWWSKGREIDLVTLGAENCAWECKWSHISRGEALKIRRALEENSALAGIKDARFGLVSREMDAGADEYFDYVADLGDIFEGKLPHHNRRKA